MGTGDRRLECGNTQGLASSGRWAAPVLGSATGRTASGADAAARRAGARAGRREQSLQARRTTRAPRNCAAGDAGRRETRGPAAQGNRGAAPPHLRAAGGGGGKNRSDELVERGRGEKPLGRVGEITGHEENGGRGRVGCESSAGWGSGTEYVIQYPGSQ